jgi:hypothetical protein
MTISPVVRMVGHMLRHEDLSKELSQGTDQVPNRTECLLRRGNSNNEDTRRLNPGQR